jgi:hypothetical protein
MSSNTAHVKFFFDKHKFSLLIKKKKKKKDYLGFNLSDFFVHAVLNTVIKYIGLIKLTDSKTPGQI